MRGRSILKESPGSSICAFCAHRLGAAQRSTHVQRRFLQSSRPKSKPPATATALREEDDGSATEYLRTNAHPPQPPIGGFARRPAFGSTNSPLQGVSSGWSKPAYGSGSVELTEKEKQARDLISDIAEQQESRVVDVFPKPGPESTRAGRPIPMPEHITGTDSANRLKAIELNSKRANAFGQQVAIKKHVLEFQDPPKWRVRRPSYSKTSHDNGISDDKMAGWYHLRRREPENENHTLTKFMQSKTEGEGSKRVGYTPILHSVSPEQSRQHPTTMVEQSNGRREYGRGSDVPRSVNAELENSQYTRFSLNRVESTKDSLVRRPVGLPSRDATAEYRSLNFPVTDAKNSEMENERETRRRTQPIKYEAQDAVKSENSEEPLRGREREKYRRRMHFNKEGEAQMESTISKTELKQKRKREKAASKAAKPTPILLPEYISVANLAAALRIRIEKFVEKMEELGFEDTGYDYVLNGENAGLIAMEYNYEPIIDREFSENLKAWPAPEDPSSLPSRPPVVTIMGHVDHGKTTLLDWLRKSSVAATEHGGITQHIGAFSVPMPSGKLITFLDTPGHAAFLSMRQRGANVTDIVILVVAADDSVKPQTIEAINHAKAAKVPIIVAINKVDKEEANIDRVKQDLARHGIEIEDFGGDTQVVCVSGKTGHGMGELEDAILTLSEILDMRADRNGQAEGWVLEASIKSMGKVATVLVRRGTMRPGDFIVAGKTWARIRCLRNEAGIDITEAGPGTPVEIDGWKEQPEAGDEVLQAPTESKAKSVVEYRHEREKRDKMAEDMRAINEARKIEQDKREREKIEAVAAVAGIEPNTSAENIEEESRGPKQIQFIVKGDVSGSVEAVVDSVSSIGNAEVQPHILRSGVGQLSEFDVEHAAAAGGCLINFNTTVDPNIARLAHAAKVRIIDHNVIYRLVDEVKATLSEHLLPLATQRVLGEADLVQVFDITIKGRQQKPIAGCKVKNGTISKNSKVRVLRNGNVIFDGTMESLKNVKKDVTEMRKGSECGIGFEGWSDFQVGDQIQCYETREEKRFL